MNISEHIKNFIQEMNRRNYTKNTIDNYVSCLNVFFSTVKKDHPKNVNEYDINGALGWLCSSLWLSILLIEEFKKDANKNNPR